MAFLIEHFGARIVGTIFEGTVKPKHRLKALDALDQAIAASDPDAILIDLSRATVNHYSATDALKLTSRINDRPRPLRRVAYVMRGYQVDMVATVMSGLHGADTFRRFENREDALAWLKQATSSTV